MVTLKELLCTKLSRMLLLLDSFVEGWGEENKKRKEAKKGIGKVSRSID
jgi:hypothetical protein